MTTEKQLNKMVNDPFVVVPLVTERPGSGDPQLSITISVKMASLQENAEASMQGAQTAVIAAGIESQRDLGLELENGVKDLQDVLGSVVGTIIDKIDVLAEVRPSVGGQTGFLTIGPKHRLLAPPLRQYSLESMHGIV